MKCWNCGTELPSKPNKEWDYRKKYYHVKSYKCSNCGKYTNEYYHNGKLSHIIEIKNWT